MRPWANPSPLSAMASLRDPQVAILGPRLLPLVMHSLGMPNAICVCGCIHTCVCMFIGVLVCMSTYVQVGVCMHVQCIHICMGLEAKVQPQGSLETLSTLFLETGFLSGLTGQRATGIHLPPLPQIIRTTPLGFCSYGFWGLNSGLHACNQNHFTS